MALPLRHLTRASSPAPAAPAPAPGSPLVPVRLAVAFAQKPLRFEIDYLGKPLWKDDAVQATTAEKTIAMPYPKEGVDLEYKVAWPAGNPLAAARLSVAAGQAEPSSKTLWGAGQVDDILTFP